MKKNATEIRRKKVEFCLNQNEYNRLQKLKGQTTERSVSSYLRKVALQKPVKVNYRNASADDFLQDMSELKLELQVIATNYNKALKTLQLLDKVDEFRSWIQIHESSRKTLLSKVDQIHFKITQLYEQWLQK